MTNSIERTCEECGAARLHRRTCSKYRQFRDSLLQPIVMPSPVVRPYCLGFLVKTVDSERHFFASPMIPFRIKGLMTWGASDETVITRVQVDNRIQAMASVDPLPARFFETGRGFGELVELLEKPLAEFPDYFESFLRARIPTMPLRQQFDFRTLSVGSQLRLSVQGPLAAIVAWGLGAEP